MVNEPDTKHHYIEFPEKRLKYYRILKEGQYWKDLPLNLQKEEMGKSFYLGDLLLWQEEKRNQYTKYK